MTSARFSDLYFRHRSSVVLMLVWPVLFWAFTRNEPQLAESLVAAGILVSGIVLRLTSLRVLGRGARVHTAGVRGGLAIDGPYAYSRNPLYVAAALILTGLAVHAGGGWFAFLLLPLTFALYTPVVLSEERAITRADAGGFAAYMKNVSRWWGPRGTPRGDEAARTPWRDVLAREKGLVPGLLLAWIGISFLHFLNPWPETLGGSSNFASKIWTVAGVGMALAGAAAANSISIERKHRRRAASAPA